MSAAGWIVAALSAVLAVAGLGMTGHMMAHMAAVAIAAPLIALGAPARGGSAGAPLGWAMAEFAIVWAWHAPALRALSGGRVDPTPLIEDSFALADGVRALEKAAERGVRKVQLVCDA